MGYVEGQNIVIEWRWGRGTTERFTEFASEAVNLNVDVIVAANTVAGYAVQKKTTRIPIVIPTMRDPVGDGFVTAFARPGGNITGLTFQIPELEGKRMQLLKELVPNASRVALLLDVTTREQRSMVNQAETAAQAGYSPWSVCGRRMSLPPRLLRSHERGPTLYSSSPGPWSTLIAPSSQSRPSRITCR